MIEYCEQVIALNLELSSDHGPFFQNYKTDVGILWSLISQFGFDRRGMYFNFSPYDVLPYVIGEHEVLIPWATCMKWISEEYHGLVADISKAAS